MSLRRRPSQFRIEDVRYHREIIQYLCHLRTSAQAAEGGEKQNIRMACRRSSLNCLSLATSEEVAKIKTARNKKERGEKETGKRAREKRILEPFDTFNHRLFSSSFSFSFFFFARPPLRAENRALSFCGNGCSNKLLSSHSLSYFPRHFLCRAVGAYRCPLFGTSTQKLAKRLQTSSVRAY